MEKLKYHYNELKNAYEELFRQFKKLPNSVLNELLDGKNTSELVRALRKYGDGYPLRAFPKRLSVFEHADIIVLFVVNFPLLNEHSIFDPFCPLPNIKYWAEGLKLKNTLDTKTIYYMALEQDCPVTGKDRTHSKKNKRLLEENGLNFEDVTKKTYRLIESLVSFQTGTPRKKKFITFTNGPRKNFSERVARLRENENACARPARLVGKKCDIMKKILNYTN